MQSFNLKKLFSWLLLFSLAMGYLESAVVVYLREILYPSGFTFPLQAMPVSMLRTEFIREISTLIMLVAIGYLTGRNLRERVAFLIFCFAVWDIFYYIFLKLLLGWPDSIFTWDLLFLIPVAWTSPVIAPIVVSVIMIVLSFVLIREPNPKVFKKIRKPVVLLITFGAIFIFTAFIWDYSGYMLKLYSLKEWLKIAYSGTETDVMQNYVPGRFNWLLFLSGAVLMLVGILHLNFGYRKRQPDVFATMH